MTIFYYLLFYLAQQQLDGELNKLLAIEAPLYQLYHVHILTKVRAKIEIHLGKIEFHFYNYCSIVYYLLLVIFYHKILINLFVIKYKSVITLL